MSTLYNAQNVTDTIDKTLFEYSYQIDVHNPINGVRKIAFKTAQAERNNETGEEKLLNYLRTLEEVYDGNETFNLISPVDGTVVGTMDYDTVFVSLYSLFFHVATKADNNG